MRRYIYQYKGADESCYVRIFFQADERAERVGFFPMKGTAVFFAERFRQYKITVGGIEQGEAGRHQEGNTQAEMRQQATQRGTYDKAQAEGSAEHTEILRPRLRCAHIGNVGGSGGEACAGHASNDAAHEQPADRWRKSHE